MKRLTKLEPSPCRRAHSTGGNRFGSEIVWLLPRRSGFGARFEPGRELLPEEVDSPHASFRFPRQKDLEGTICQSEKARERGGSRTLSRRVRTIPRKPERSGMR